MNNLPSLLEAQINKINSEQFNDCKNRKGVRYISGELLAKAYWQLVNDLKVYKTLEIGAHEASFSKQIKKMNNLADCYAFEANPYVFEQYEKELTAIGIKYFNVAISENTGRITLNIPISRGEKSIEVTNPISSIYKRDQPGFMYRSVEVESMRVDEVINEGDRLAIWVDVEGAQYEVLKSFGDILKDVELIYIEIEVMNVWESKHQKNDILKLLSDGGFVEIMRDGLASGQYNSVFAKTSIVNNPKLNDVVEKFTTRLVAL